MPQPLGRERRKVPDPQTQHFLKSQKAKKDLKDLGFKNSSHIFLFAYSKHKPQKQVETLLFLCPFIQVRQKFSLSKVNKLKP